MPLARATSTNTHTLCAKLLTGKAANGGPVHEPAPALSSAPILATSLHVITIRHYAGTIQLSDENPGRRRNVHRPTAATETRQATQHKSITFEPLTRTMSEEDAGLADWCLEALVATTHVITALRSEHNQILLL